jgi:ppGpp synthetase/RelA/SpoT-type nucleotidyltranferase
MIALGAVVVAADYELGIDEMEFTVPAFKRERVNIAGRKLVEAIDADWESWDDFDWDEYYDSLDVINNWRSAHAYPLLVMRTTLGRYARKVDPDALIAQRIKRLVSTGAKLKREPKMKLSQMQDIGGCRAVVSSIDHLRRLKELYEKSDIKHTRASFDDYIDRPRKSGYRGYHLVYRYRSDKAPKAVYNDLKIEMQLRSQ